MKSDPPKSRSSEMQMMSEPAMDLLLKASYRAAQKMPPEERKKVLGLVKIAKVMRRRRLWREAQTVTSQVK